MLKKDLRKLIEGTSDAAYVVNSEGVVVAWNKAAQKLFGVSAQQAIGQACRTIVQGIDECGVVCSPNCTVQQAISRRHPLKNFDLQVAARGCQMCPSCQTGCCSRGNRRSGTPPPCTPYISWGKF